MRVGAAVLATTFGFYLADGLVESGIYAHMHATVSHEMSCLESMGDFTRFGIFRPPATRLKLILILWGAFAAWYCAAVCLLLKPIHRMTYTAELVLMHSSILATTAWLCVSRILDLPSNLVLSAVSAAHLLHELVLAADSRHRVGIALALLGGFVLAYFSVIVLMVGPISRRMRRMSQHEVTSRLRRAASVMLVLVVLAAFVVAHSRRLHPPLIPSLPPPIGIAENKTIGAAADLVMKNESSVPPHSTAIINKSHVLHSDSISIPPPYVSQPVAPQLPSSSVQAGLSILSIVPGMLVALALLVLAVLYTSSRDAQPPAPTPKSRAARASVVGTVVMTRQSSAGARVTVPNKAVDSTPCETIPTQRTSTVSPLSSSAADGPHDGPLSPIPTENLTYVTDALVRKPFAMPITSSPSSSELAFTNASSPVEVNIRYYHDANGATNTAGRAEVFVSPSRENLGLESSGWPRQRSASVPAESIEVRSQPHDVWASGLGLVPPMRYSDRIIPNRAVSQLRPVDAEAAFDPWSQLAQLQQHDPTAQAPLTPSGDRLLAAVERYKSSTPRAITPTPTARGTPPDAHRQAAVSCAADSPPAPATASAAVSRTTPRSPSSSTQPPRLIPSPRPTASPSQPSRAPALPSPRENASSARRQIQCSICGTNVDMLRLQDHRRRCAWTTYTGNQPQLALDANRR